jgi:membrane-bound lytic murein transglycosylase D
MNVRELPDPCRRYVINLVFTLSLGVALGACASKKDVEAPPPTPAPPAASTSQPATEASPASSQATTSDEPSPEVESLYGALEEIEDDFGAILERLSAGETVEDEELMVLAERLQTGAHQCAETEGCDTVRYLEVMGTLLEEQNVALVDQASRLESLKEAEGLDEGLLREPGTSPFVSAMPELGDTVSLLRGTDLRDIINLNGPVKAALDDWLTWNRPMLMNSYENYQYLHDKIAPIYEEAGLPEALLFAMIATETGGKVHAYSHAGATGLLQFMRTTGRRYGLGTEDGFDMRLDPEAATRANVAYLNDQFEVLNDSLELTLAAYNGGEHRLKRLHRRYKASFWDQRVYYRLPRETREYVPRILAAAWLFLHPEDYNLEFPDLANELTELVLQRDASLGELTICLGQVDSHNGWFRTLRNLNPRLSPGERVAAGETIEIPKLLVPYYEERCLQGDLVETAFELHEANYPYGKMDVYIVRRGDTLGRIASRYRCVSTRELAEINNVRPPRYLIRVGQRLRIPGCP